MSIPLSYIININTSVLDVGNSSNTLYGLLLTDKAGFVPAGQTTLFNNAGDVGALFGYNSQEYTLAYVYFSSFVNSNAVPNYLYIAPFYTSDAPAYLKGGTLAAMTLEQLQFTVGNISVTIDGTVKTATNVEFTKATSFSNAATILSEKLGVNVTFNDHSFVITSPTAGSGSSVGFASGTLADALRLTQATSAKQSEAVSNPTVASLMDELRDENNKFCSVFLSFEATLEQKLAFSKWADGQKEGVAVILSDSNANALVKNGGASFAEQVTAAEYAGTISVYDNLELCAVFASVPASWDFNQKDGRSTLAFRRSTTNNIVVPNVTNKKDAQALEANGYNFMGVYASAMEDFKWPYPGSVSGDRAWCDSFFCNIAMKRFMEYYLGHMLQSKGQIPYNNDGKGYISACLVTPINVFTNFGAIRNGVVLDDNQKLALQQDGLNTGQISTIVSNGWYLLVDMAKTSAQTRAQRGSPPISFWYTDGQSVQRIDMNSVEIK